MKRLTMVLVMMLALASCQILGGDDEGDGGANTTAAVDLIQWERSPQTIVFRAEVTGGQNSDAFFMRNEVPLCTIYGDSHVVWAVTSGDNTTQILFDRLDDGIIRRFVEDLTVAYQIYNYDARADLEPPSDIEPVVEKLTLNVNGREHVTDAFGGWNYAYFEEITNRCQSLSQTPVIFEPTEAWISVQESPYNPNTASVRWDAASSGLDLAELAASGERRWITGRNVRVIWNVIRTATLDAQFEQGGGNYVIALEVPSVTREAPPRPED